MSNGISDKESGLPVLKEPDQSRVWAGKSGDESGLVQLQDGLGRFFLQPEGLREFEAGLMEPRSAFTSMSPGVLGIEVAGCVGKERIQQG